MRLACLLLAAGAGSRFGGCKQLATLDGKPLLRHGLDALAPLFGEHLYIVLGANRSEIDPVVGDSARVIVNDGWRQGLGSSIAAGVTEITANPNYDGILTALGDQPRLTAADYSLLIEKFDRRRIVAARYAKQPGVPALFPQARFEALMQLDGDQGARSLLRQSRDQVVQVSLPTAAKDIDTPADIDALRLSPACYCNWR